MSLRFSVALGLLCITICLPVTSVVGEDANAHKGDGSINILLITSGCCHDYDFQTKAMQLAMEKHGVEAVWTVVNEGGKGTKAEIEFYKNPKWAVGFDVVYDCRDLQQPPNLLPRLFHPDHDQKIGKHLCQLCLD